MIRNYKTEDEDALHSLWNTAGVKQGFAPLSQEKFHKLLTGHPDFSPEYTFVMEERGTVCGFVNGCTGGHIPKGDVRGYFSCLILSAAADTAENSRLLLEALEYAFRKAGKTYSAVTFSIPSVCPGLSRAPKTTSTTMRRAFRWIFPCMTGCCLRATGSQPGNAPCI